MFSSVLKRAWYLAFSLAFVTTVQTAAHAQVLNPDLTAPGVIDALQNNPFYSSRPYRETFNLGATGLRGWIYIDETTDQADHYGIFTAPSRQILITVAEAPGSAVLAVKDVILGATAVTTGAVPLFTADCRKTLGAVIASVEDGPIGSTPKNLRVKRWRNGVITDVSFPMTPMSTYSATAPYNCPKSTAVLAGARTKLIAELAQSGWVLPETYTGAINGLALMASVTPTDPGYADVKEALKNYADTLGQRTFAAQGTLWWDVSYMGIFLSEYYLRSLADSLLPGGAAPDTSVLATINRFTFEIARGQSNYGTYSHDVIPYKLDGSLHGTIPGYGALNQVAIPTNIAIVLGKKALLAGNLAIDPEINSAIQRGSNFYRFYVNKGCVPYGESNPMFTGHTSNGREAMCAVLFGLQSNSSVETEYFARMSVASCTGRESGHTGTGLGELWGAMGAHIGGPVALAKYMETFRWHSDLGRRTDGSFAFAGSNAWNPYKNAGGGFTSDGSYLGRSEYYDLNTTAVNILNFCLPLKRLIITGRDANPAYFLSSPKIANAISAATYKLDCPSFSNAQLIAGLTEFDPIVRSEAAIRLLKRAVTAAERTTLRAMAVDMSNANARGSACKVLGALRDSNDLQLLKERLSDPDKWVRGQAAHGICSYNPSVATSIRDEMLATFVTNSTDPNVILWDDPLQMGNSFLSSAIFGNPTQDGLPGNNDTTYVRDAPKNLLYPALRVGMKQCDSYSRFGVAQFINDRLELADIQALATDVIEMTTTRTQGDTMWYIKPQMIGLDILAKYNCAELVPAALTFSKSKLHWGWSSTIYMPPAMNALIAQGDRVRWTLPQLRRDLIASQVDLHPSDKPPIKTLLENTINTIRNSVESGPELVPLLPIAKSQVVATTTPKVITLTGTSPRSSLSYTVVTGPFHGTLSGTGPSRTYTPNAGYDGVDHFTFTATDTLTTSASGTVNIIVGTAGTGLLGTYFDNIDFTGEKMSRVDEEMNFNWGMDSPAPSIGAETFSVRWRGQLLIPETGNYTFSSLSDDGFRVTIDGVKVIDNLTNHAATWDDSVTIPFTAGRKVDIIIDYFDDTNASVAKLKWSGPKFTGDNGSIISKEWLFPGASLPIGPPGYTWCCFEGSDYPLSGLCDVAYGGNGLFKKLYNQTGTIAFNNSTFAPDPLPGQVKSGFYRKVGSSGSPTVEIAAYAFENPVTGTSTTLQVLGADNAGEAGLIYTWATVGTPPAAVSFSLNNSNAANTSTATFTQAGTYELQCVMENAAGFSIASNVTVTVNQTPSSTVIITPAVTEVNLTNSQQFTASATDQFGKPLANSPTFVWSLSNSTSGSISNSGLFKANLTVGGPYTVRATSGGSSATAALTVVAANLPAGVSELPVSNGLVLRMDASLISGTANGAQLNTWNDTSGAANNAVRQTSSSSGYPKYIANGVNGRPVVRFNSDASAAGDCLKFNQITTARTVFWVIKENEGLGDGHFLLGNSDQTTYDFHRGSANGPLWESTVSSANIRSGVTKLMGNPIDGTSTALPSGSFQLVSLVTTGNVRADQICQDRTFHGSWQGDIAEILIYDRALNAGEEAQIGTYLSHKYNLPTAYNALPVASGLVLQMDASKIVGLADGTQLETWKDASTTDNDAIRQSGSSSGYPKYIASGINGLPVVRFNSANASAGDFLKFNRISNIQSVFWVLKETANLSTAPFLLGDDTTYHFHRGGNNGPIWNEFGADPKITTGTTKLMGNTVNGTTTSLPSGNFQLVSLVTTGDVEANQICQDRTWHGSWRGDIAEILIYNRALTNAEEAAVGKYLSTKYQLATSYPAPTMPATPTALAAVAEATGGVRVSWAPVNGAASYRIWNRNVQTGVEQYLSSTTTLSTVTGLIDGNEYHFRVAAVYSNGVTGNYSLQVAATPITVASTYTTWASNLVQGLTAGTNNGISDDPDHDGLSNLMEFVLGSAPMTHSRTVLPIMTRDNSSWYFSYSRSDLAHTTTRQVMEYSTDLKNWTEMVIPAASEGRVTVTNGLLADQIKVLIPTEAGKPNFVRLKVSQ